MLLVLTESLALRGNRRGAGDSRGGPFRVTTPDLLSSTASLIPVAPSVLPCAPSVLSFTLSVVSNHTFLSM